MNRKVWIHSTNDRRRYKFFYPRFINIHVGDTIQWFNKDKQHHTLVFNKEISPYEIKIGKIEVDSPLSKKFDHFVSRIDYGCILHPEEGGTIFMHSNQKTNFESSKEIEIKERSINYMRISNDSKIAPQLLPIHLDLNSEVITLERFVDPQIFTNLSKPHFYEIHSKIMTTVFWDLSGFSSLCNELLEEPSTLVVFLNEFFTEAIKIIHKYGGVIDKFMGDRIMVYFGFDNDNNNNQIVDTHHGIYDAINAAVELKKII